MHVAGDVHQSSRGHISSAPQLLALMRAGQGRRAAALCYNFDAQSVLLLCATRPPPFPLPCRPGGEGWLPRTPPHLLIALGAWLQSADVHGWPPSPRFHASRRGQHRTAFMQHTPLPHAK